jgi:predicted transcriptional regulator
MNPSQFKGGRCRLNVRCRIFPIFILQQNTQTCKENLPIFRRRRAFWKSLDQSSLPQFILESLKDCDTSQSL